MKPIGSLIPPVLPLGEPAQRTRAVAHRDRLRLPSLPADASVEVISGVRIPKPSRWLQDAMDDANSPHPNTGRNYALASDAVITEARRAIGYVREALMVKPTAEQWRLWLLPLVAELVASPDSREKVMKAAETFAFYLDEIPLALLTVDAQKRAIVTMRFWPKVNDLAAFFDAELNRLRVRERRLAAVLRPQQPERTGPITPVEREAVRAGMAALRDELAALVPKPGPSKPTPGLQGQHLSEWRARQREQTAQADRGGRVDG